MLLVIRTQVRFGFSFQQKLVIFIPAAKIHSPLGDHNPVVRNFNLNFALKFHFELGQRQFKRALVIDFFASRSQLSLNINARGKNFA